MRTEEDVLRANLTSAKARARMWEDSYYEAVGNIKIAGQILVIRMPSLMEDEGNFHPLFLGKDWPAVNEFVREFTEDGYFSSGDLLYTGGLSMPGPNEFELKSLRNWLRELHSGADKSTEAS